MGVGLAPTSTPVLLGEAGRAAVSVPPAALPAVVSVSLEEPERLAESCRRRGGEGGLRRLPLGCSGGGGAAGDSGPSSLWPQILVANDRACRLLGHSSHDLIGQKLTQFFLKPDPDVVQALSEEHVEADGHAAVAFGTVVSVGLWAAGAHGRLSRPWPWRRAWLGRGWAWGRPRQSGDAAPSWCSLRRSALASLQGPGQVPGAAVPSPHLRLHAPWCGGGWGWHGYRGSLELWALPCVCIQAGR